MDNLAVAYPPEDLAELVRLQRLFADTIPLVDAEAPVAWCGTWTVGDLVDHLTSVHRWAAAMARDQDEQPPSPSQDRRQDYRSAAAELSETLAALDPRAPARTLVPGGTVAFWRRRQLHETLIHLWDLRSAGALGLAVDPVLWADTVDEVVTVMHPRQVRLGRAPAAPVRIALTATDLGRSWTLPAAAGASRAVTASGPAEALALLLWGRATVVDPRLSVSGATDTLAAVLADRFVP